MKSLYRPICFVLTLVSALVGCVAAPSAQRSEYPDDAAITAMVEAALHADSSLEGSRITVETARGKVQLSGVVDEREDVIKAAEIAGAVTGVRVVMNDLLVK
jgi:hyperosmotically inducible protein